MSKIWKVFCKVKIWRTFCTTLFFVVALLYPINRLHIEVTRQKIASQAVSNKRTIIESVHPVDNGYYLKGCEQQKLKGSIEVDLDKAEQNYWVLSNSTSPVEEASYNGTFLGPTIRRELAADVYQPTLCRPQQTIAIIIPFRRREYHLRTLLGHLIPVLRRQQIRYSIFVVEQTGEEIFNKGRLMNTAFNFAAEAGRTMGTPFDCFIFQDVDLLVENDTLLYRCSGDKQVDHLSTRINKFDYEYVCCGMTVGGVLALQESQFRKINGYPNSYWGWGAEDDDINKRLEYKGYKVVRPESPLGRFTMIKHERDKQNPKNYLNIPKMAFVWYSWEDDGLINLKTKIVGIEKFPLFTKILVDVGAPVFTLHT